jgi:prepilin peptidase CpaA
MNWAAFLDFTSFPIGLGRLVALGVLAGGACIWDLRFRQIPNLLTVPIAILGLALAIADSGLSGGGWALAGLLAGAGLFILPVTLDYVGAGDLKMMAAAGTLLGPLGIFKGVLLGSVFGGVWALAWVIAKGKGKSTLPYAPPLALGTIVAFSIGS